MPPLVQDSFPHTPGKGKMERSGSHFGRVANRWLCPGSAQFFFWSFVLVGFMFYAVVHISPSRLHFMQHHSTSSSSVKDLAWGGPHWEKQVKQSAHPKRETGLIVLVTGAAGFVGTHVSLALKRRGDGVVGIDNFNNYYDPSLKRARQYLLDKEDIFVVEGDINDDILLKKLFSMIPFTHVMHLAAQAGVRYAMENPGSYVHSNVAGLVTLLESCKGANPQPAIIWASSSSVYGLNSKAPFSEADRTDQPASLYAATKKAGEEIAHTYHHIHGLSITGLRFFTVYGPWGRPDMAYFSFTKNILQGKPIDIYQGPNKVYPARDFTYIDDVVRGCMGALDTAKKSTGSGSGSGSGSGKNGTTAQLRIFNLGNTSPVPVSTLVSILEKYLRTKAIRNLVRMPRNGDVPFTHANISLARAEFGYAPTTNLATGLKRFVKWYMSFYDSHHDKKFHE